MYRVRTLIDADVILATRATAKQAPRRMRRELGKVARGPIAQRIIKRLSAEPPVPRGRKKRWNSERQKRAFFATDGFGGGIPHKRKHRISRAWTVLLDSIQEGQGLFIVENHARGVQFVQGDYTQKMHLDTGWPQAAVIVADESEAMQDAVIDVWFTVTEAI